MDLRRRGTAVLVTVAVALGLGGCARPGAAAAGNSSAAQAADGRAAGLAQSGDPNKPGARPMPAWPGCDTSPQPPRKAAIIAYDGGGRTRWSVPLPAGPVQDSNVGPMVDGDVVFSTEGDELRALRAADGGHLWRLALGGWVYDASVSDGVIVARVGPLDDGHVVGVDAGTGAELWRWTQPRGAAMSWQELPTADGGVVVTGALGSLVVLDRHDGRVRWTRQPRERSTPRVFATAGNRVLWLDGGALEEFDAAGGRRLWRVAGAGRPGDFSLRLTVTGGIVVVTVGLQPAYRPVTAYDLATGRQRWRLDRLRDGSVVGAGPAGLAVVADAGKARWDDLALVDASTGAVRWRRPLTGWIRQDMVDDVDRQALVTADLVVAVEEVSNLVVARDAANGAIRWRRPLDAFPGTPRWTDAGRLLLTATHDVPDASASAKPEAPDESLLSIDTGSGQVRSRSPLPLPADRPATPLGDGAVIQVADPMRACLTDGGAEAGVATTGPVRG
jgi:outer membrane protein assembly factor BamB